MGPRISKNLSMSAIRLDDYEQVQLRQNVDQMADYKILRNRLTGNQMQEYTLQFGDATEYQDYYDAFYWRLSQDHVVRTLHFIDNTRRQFCSTTYVARLYTERIPMKLSDIKDIPYPDNLYVLLSSLDGFDRIVQKTGYFEIEEYMICINKQGEVKVWINDNLSRNYPDVVRNKRVNSEEEMVRKLIGIIEGNTDKTSQPSSLAGYIYSQVSNPSFGDAMLLVRQYARENRIEIPTNFQCIMEVLNNSRYQSEHSRSNPSISHYSNIRSSVPHLKMRNDLLTPSFHPGLVTQQQADPRVPHFSRVSYQPGNSRFNNHQVIQKSVVNSSNPMVVRQHNQVRRTSRSPIPVNSHVASYAAAPMMKQMVISPQKRGGHHQLSHHRQVAQRNYSPTKVNPNHSRIQQSKSLGKSVSYTVPQQYTKIIHQQHTEQVSLPTPFDARQISQVQYSEVPINVSQEHVGHSYETLQQQNIQRYQHNYRNTVNHPAQVVAHQNILIENKEEQSKGRIVIQQKRTQTPHRQLASEFINPFYQEQDSPEFIPQASYMPEPYPQLRIQTRQNQHLQLQTSGDMKNEQQLQEIKRNKAELLKQAKQMVNKMMKEPEVQDKGYERQYREVNEQRNYYNQGYNQKSSGFNQQKSKQQGSMTYNNNTYNQQQQYHRQNSHQENNKLIMSFERKSPEQAQRVQQNDILVYHSPTDFHQIDPEIARDLLALGE